MLFRSGVCERTIEAHTHDIEDIAALPCGTRLLSASDDGTAKLWTLDGELERTFEVSSLMLCVAALPDGVHFVFGLFSAEIRLYHVDGTLVHTFEGHTGQVNAVTVMPDGQRILSGSDKEVRVWLLNGTHQNTFQLHTSYVNALVALPDNQHALSGSDDKTVKLFNVNDGSVLRTFTHHTSFVRCLALLPDGLRFVSGSHDEPACVVEHGLAPLVVEEPGGVPVAVDPGAHVPRDLVVEPREQLAESRHAFLLAHDASSPGLRGIHRTTSRGGSICASAPSPARQRRPPGPS